MFEISTRTFVVGQPLRILALRKAFKPMVDHPQPDKVWFATTGEIARHEMPLPAGTVPGS